MSEDVNDFGEMPRQSAQDEQASASLWHYLREAREANGLSVAEVAHHLKLAPKQIEAIEAGDLARLPGATFARGFVRNYARFLHLNEAPFLAALEPAREVQLPAAPAGLARMPSGSKSRFSSLPALLITLVLLGVVVAGVYYGWFEQREESSLAEVMSASDPLAERTEPPSATVQEQVNVAPPGAPQTQSAAAAPAIPATAAPPPATSEASAPSASAPLAQVSQSAPVAAPVVGSGQQRLVFAFEGESWVEVRDASGTIIFSRLNSPGTSQEVQGSGPFQLVVGNARAVRLTFNGKQVDLAPHIRVDVARFSLQ